MEIHNPDFKKFCEGLIHSFVSIPYVMNLALGNIGILEYFVVAQSRAVTQAVVVPGIF